MMFCRTDVKVHWWGKEYTAYFPQEDKLETQKLSWSKLLKLQIRKQLCYYDERDEMNPLIIKIHWWGHEIITYGTGCPPIRLSWIHLLVKGWAELNANEK